MVGRPSGFHFHPPESRGFGFEEPGGGGRNPNPYRVPLVVEDQVGQWWIGLSSRLFLLYFFFGGC